MTTCATVQAQEVYDVLREFGKPTTLNELAAGFRDKYTKPQVENALRRLLKFGLVDYEYQTVRSGGIEQPSFRRLYTAVTCSECT